MAEDTNPWPIVALILVCVLIFGGIAYGMQQTRYERAMDFQRSQQINRSAEACRDNGLDQGTCLKMLSEAFAR